MFAARAGLSGARTGEYTGILGYRRKKKRVKSKHEHFRCWVPFVLPACVATVVGLLIMMGGVAMCTIGYYAEDFAEHAASQKEDPDWVRGYMYKLTYVGPVCMAIGCFAMIISCVSVCETRDRLLKQIIAKEIEREKNHPVQKENKEPGCCERLMRNLVDKYKATKQQHLMKRKSGHRYIDAALRTVPRDIFSIDMEQNRDTSLIPIPRTNPLLYTSDVESMRSMELCQGLDTSCGTVELNPNRCNSPWYCSCEKDLPNTCDHHASSINSLPPRLFCRYTSGSDYDEAFSDASRGIQRRASLAEFKAATSMQWEQSLGGCDAEIDSVNWETISVCNDSSDVIANSLESTIDTRDMFLSIVVRDSASPLLAMSAKSEIGSPETERKLVIVHQASVHEEDVISVHTDDPVLNSTATNPEEEEEEEEEEEDAKDQDEKEEDGKNPQNSLRCRSQSSISERVIADNIHQPADSLTSGYADKWRRNSSTGISKTDINDESGIASGRDVVSAEFTAIVAPKNSISPNENRCQNDKLCNDFFMAQQSFPLLDTGKARTREIICDGRFSRDTPLVLRNDITPEPSDSLQICGDIHAKRNFTVNGDRTNRSGLRDGSLLGGGLHFNNMSRSVGSIQHAIGQDLLTSEPDSKPTLYS